MLTKKLENMIQSYSDLKYYIRRDREALGKTGFPSLFGDEVWKMEIHLRLAEFLENTKGRNPFRKLLARYVKYRLKVRCTKRCCELPLNVIGPGLCIWHGFGIIINQECKIGENFGISAFCNVGHAKNKVPVIGNNVSMSFGSNVLGGIHICNNVTIGARALVIKDVDTEYVTLGGVPAKILSLHDSNKPLLKG